MFEHRQSDGVINLNVPRSWLWRRIANRRQAIARRFLELMHVSQADSCLEVGGPAAKITEELLPHFGNYLVANIELYELKQLEGSSVHPVLCDATHLPIADKSVDFCFSHAVIEHIPDNQREQFANEIRRVARRGYFVSTSNYWFPFEPHYKKPFFQWIPDAIKRQLLEHFSIGIMKQHNWFPIHLMSRRSLKMLFPGAMIGAIGRIPIIREHIYAYQRLQRSSSSLREMT